MLAAGTNAWTAVRKLDISLLEPVSFGLLVLQVDNTTYTVNSACEGGMLQLIPVFLDHILFPSMTPELFTTEIYHVDGKGEEGGVVFSEMQGREGSPGDVLDQTCVRPGRPERSVTEALIPPDCARSSTTRTMRIVRRLAARSKRCATSRFRTVGRCRRPPLLHLLTPGT